MNLNPFRRRVRIPIRKMPGGWEPWNNRQPPKAMSWRPFVMAFVGIFGICGIIYGLWMTFLAPDPVVETPTPTLNLMSADSFIEEIIYFERTPGSRFRGDFTATPTMESTYTPTTTLTAMTPTATANMATYTPYPTYTYPPPIIQELIITSPPEIIYQGGEIQYQEIVREIPYEVTVEVIQTIVVIQPVIITATPSPTPPPPPGVYPTAPGVSHATH